MNPRYKSLLIYIAKNLAGILISFAISRLLPQVDFTWCVISVILVLSPEGTDAPDLAVTRIKANVVGVGIGLALLFTGIPGPFNMLAGTVLALWICDLLKLNAGARSAVVAMLIILLYQEGPHLWDGAFQRMNAVISGCLTGLLVTYVFHSIFHLRVTSEAAPRNKPEREA